MSDLRFRLSRFAACFSIGLAFGLLLVYGFRPDWATALTIFPAWSWLGFWMLSLASYKSRRFQVASFIWLLFAIFTVEEIPSLLRDLSQVPESEVEIKAITINCSGRIEPIQTALQCLPDVLLTQESPSQKEIAELLAGSSYVYIYGMDASIIVKGAITPSEKGSFFTAGIASIHEKLFFVTSLRLATSDVRIDLWDPECWKSQRQMREKQVLQIHEIKSKLPQNMPIILGGDFNVPQGDRVFKEIDLSLHDSFKNCGRGWCNTIINDLPLLRIDQIWVTSDLLSVDAFVRNCAYTDHKMYFTYLRFK